MGCLSCHDKQYARVDVYMIDIIIMYWLCFACVTTHSNTKMKHI